MSKGIGEGGVGESCFAAFASKALDDFGVIFASVVTVSDDKIWNCAIGVGAWSVHIHKVCIKRDTLGGT